MSATIDVTRRARIRALAVRMYRAQIAGVFSIADGAPAVDESAFTPDQRAEAAKILEEQAAASVDIKDVETAASVAAIIPRYVKPSCPVCHGEGVARRGGVDDICACVDRRWQTDLDHQAFVEGLHAPGRASGVRVESTRAADDAKRLAEAREALARAHAAALAACADVDAKIKSLEGEGTACFAERAQLEARRLETSALVEEQERLADEHGKATAEARADVESVALRIGHLVAPLFQYRSAEQAAFADDRATAHALLDQVFAAAAAADASQAKEWRAREAARVARADVQALYKQIATIDANNAPLIDEITRLRTERARIVRHHQPKIDRAEKRVRRLAYVTGSDSPVGTERS